MVCLLLSILIRFDVTSPVLATLCWKRVSLLVMFKVAERKSIQKCQMYVQKEVYMLTAHTMEARFTTKKKVSIT